jgi:hypothetical protein
MKYYIILIIHILQISTVHSYIIDWLHPIGCPAHQILSVGFTRDSISAPRAWDVPDAACPLYFWPRNPMLPWHAPPPTALLSSLGQWLATERFCNLIVNHFSDLKVSQSIHIFGSLINPSKRTNWAWDWMAIPVSVSVSWIWLQLLSKLLAQIFSVQPYHWELYKEILKSTNFRFGSPCGIPIWVNMSKLKNQRQMARHCRY